MMPPPGAGMDFDRAVADALVNSAPNIQLIEPNSNRPESLLMLVAINGRRDLMEVLLAAGATMSVDEFARVLWWWPDTETVSCLLHSGVPHDAGSVETALRHGQWDAVEMLLDHGADINGVYYATYLLHIAASQGEQAVLENLLRRRADVHRRDVDDFTALMKVCDSAKNRHETTPLIVETLLQHGSDPNAVTRRGETPLLLCSASKLRKADQIIRVLLKYGADPNCTSRAGTTPLMLAARDNNLPLAITLIEAGAILQIQTLDGRTAHDIAVQYKSEDVLALLESHPAQTAFPN